MIVYHYCVLLIYHTFIALDNAVVYEYTGSSLQLSAVEKAAVELTRLADQHGVNRQFKRDMMNTINKTLLSKISDDALNGRLIKNVKFLITSNINPTELGGMMPSPDTVSRWICSSHDGFQVVSHFDVCPNGCFLYPKDDANILFCTNENCQLPRYRKHEQALALRQAGVDLNDESFPSFVAVQQMAVVSVGAALAQMMLDEDKRELFKYRAEQDCTHEDGVYRDIFDGKVYQDFLFNQQQLFQDDSDIGIVLFVDGFQPKVQTGSTLTIIHCLVMNISPSYRQAYCY